MARSGDDVVRVKVVAGPFPATGRRRSKTTQRAGLRNARTPSGVYFVREAHNWTMRPGEKSGVRNGQSSCIGMGFYLRHWDCAGIGPGHVLRTQHSVDLRDMLVPPRGG